MLSEQGRVLKAFREMGFEPDPRRQGCGECALRQDFPGDCVDHPAYLRALQQADGSNICYRLFRSNGVTRDGWRKCRVEFPR